MRTLVCVLLACSALSGVFCGKNKRPTGIDLANGGARPDGKFHNKSHPMVHNFVNHHHGLYLPGVEEWPADHSNNWAVIVDASIFWYNYRHVANALAVYRAVKQLGIPDSNIILMLGDEVPCNPRNSEPGTVYHDRGHKTNVYGDDVEVDYRGYEVSVESVIRVLTGRHAEDVPRSKRMMSDKHSNILLYMTGHGGDEFLKFLDSTEITSDDLADAFDQMWELNRYHEIFFVADTCEATTLYQQFTSPNVIGLGSSLVGESSWAHGTDPSLGVSLIDRFTHHLLGFLAGVGPDSEKKLSDMMGMRSWSWNSLNSQAAYRHDLLMSRPFETVRITDFFGAVGSAAILLDDIYPIERDVTLAAEPPVTPTESTASHPSAGYSASPTSRPFVTHGGVNIQFVGAGLVFLSILFGLSLQGIL